MGESLCSFRLARLGEFSWQVGSLPIFQFQLYMDLFVGFYQVFQTCPKCQSLRIPLNNVILASPKWNRRTHIILQIWPSYYVYRERHIWHCNSVFDYRRHSSLAPTLASPSFDSNCFIQQIQRISVSRVRAVCLHAFWLPINFTICFLYAWYLSRSTVSRIFLESLDLLSSLTTSQNFLIQLTRAANFLPLA